MSDVVVSVRLGSSPRVRGKLAGDHAQFERWRLIPARAGKTIRAAVGVVVDRAHPRACGENRTPEATPEVTMGSSPRVRGKPSG